MICGFILPQAYAVADALILPALTVILTITLLKIPRGFFRRPKTLLFASIQGNVMNYLLLGNFIILTGIFFILKQDLWIGMVLIAAMPPSVDIIPLGNLLRADKTSIFTGLAGAYLGALLIIPLIGLGFLKYIPLNYWNIILLIVELILLPLVSPDSPWKKNGIKSLNHTKKQ